MPTATPVKVDGAVVEPSMRSRQPVRRLEPGGAFSMSSMALKWLRLGEVCPTACTKASCLASQRALSGLSEGCRPKVRSSMRARDCGSAMVGRALA